MKYLYKKQFHKDQQELMCLFSTLIASWILTLFSIKDHFINGQFLANGLPDGWPLDSMENPKECMY